MNRRRFLGSVFALTAALGVTRVPDSVQASGCADCPADEFGHLHDERFTPQRIAQARADGYNRGREVEEARQEARSEKQASA